MPYAGVNGQRLYYEIAGDGEIAVLLHGSFADADIMEAPATGLSSGFRTLRVDRRGHGRSSEFKGPVSLQDETADITALLDWFSAGTVHMLGHDDGAEVAIEFALTHPDRTLSLVLLAPSVEGFPWSEETAAFRKDLVNTFRTTGSKAMTEKLLASPIFDGAKEREGVFDRIADIYRRAKWAGGSFERPPREGPTQFQRLPEIKARTAIFVGEKDEPERLRCAGRMRDLIPGAQLVTIPGTSRFFHIEEARPTMRRMTDFYIPEEV
jgi:3-oxoadipate enol-lactonase